MDDEFNFMSEGAGIDPFSEQLSNLDILRDTESQKAKTRQHPEETKESPSQREWPTDGDGTSPQEDHDTDGMGSLIDETEKMREDMQRAREALERGSTSSETALTLSTYVEGQMERCIGVAPLNIRNKDVQLRLSEDNEILGRAFSSRMLRPFVVGVNNACIQMCSGLMFMSMVRSLLRQCLVQQTIGSKGREHFSNLLDQMSTQTDKVLERANCFVHTMAVLNRDVGNAAELMRYSPNMDLLLDSLKTVCNGIAEEAKQSEDVTQEMKDTAKTVGKFIMSQLTREGDYQVQQNRVADAHTEWQKSLVEYKIALAKRDDKRRELISSKTRLCGVISTVAQTKTAYEARIESFEPRLEMIRERIERFESIKADLVANRPVRMEEELNKTPRALTNEMIADEVARQQGQIQEQIRKLEKQRLRHVGTADDLLSKSLVASDGMERVVEKRHSIYTWWNKTEPPDRVRSVQVHVNEKRRLQEMAESHAEEARGIETRITGLRKEHDNAKKKVIAALRKQIKQTAGDIVARGTGEYNAKANELHRQIQNLKALQNTVRGERNVMMANVRHLVEELARYKGDLHITETETAQMEENTDLLFESARDARAHEQNMRGKYYAQKERLETFLSAFDNLSSMKDFASYERLLNLLTEIVDDVPRAVKSLNDAIQSAFQLFQSEVFGKNLESLPEHMRAIYLTDQTSQVHALCELAHEVMGVPLQMLLIHGTKDLAERIAMDNAPTQALEAPQHNPPMIEPPSVSEPEENDQPRRHEGYR